MASLPEHLSQMPAGRHRLSPEVMASHQRDRVLAAATEVFAKRGYRGTTIDHIVAAAKTGVGSFYELFENKEDCFLQAYDRIIAAARDRLIAAVPAGASPAEQACVGLRVLLNLIAAEPLRARLVLVEAQAAGPRALARYEKSLDVAVPLLRSCRLESPVTDELPETLELAIVGGAAWLLNQRLVMGEVADIEALFPELVDIVLAPYLGEADAARLAAANDGVVG
jgi:AcrR family transcriptional regulator